jgi:hypothetical protein
MLKNTVNHKATIFLPIFNILQDDLKASFTTCNTITLL